SSWIYCAYHIMTTQLGTMDSVKRAEDLYGDFHVMVTGHSREGAMASFWGLDL
ncbi:hypothetical protein ACJRO7_032315, partial [Eucalyptus globulus]